MSQTRVDANPTHCASELLNTAKTVASALSTHTLGGNHEPLVDYISHKHVTNRNFSRNDAFRQNSFNLSLDRPFEGASSVSRIVPSTRTTREVHQVKSQAER